MPPLATSILLTLAAAIALEFTASAPGGGSSYAVLVTVLLIVGQVLALGFRRWFPAPKFVIGRPGCIAGACVVALLALETLSSQAVTVAMIPIRAREAAQLGSVVIAGDRLWSDSTTYTAPLRMEGYDAHVTAMPGLLAAYSFARHAGADWRLASLAGLALAAAFAIGSIVLLTTRPGPGMAIAASVAGFGAIYLLPSCAQSITWSTHAPIWGAIAAFTAGLTWRIPTLSGIAIGVLASMSVGWLVMMPAACALVWVLHERRALPGLILGALIAGSFLMLVRGEFAAFLAGVIGGPALMADPRQAAELEPWRYPTLTGALTTFILAPPLLAWGGLWALRAAWIIAQGHDKSRAMEHFALAAFVVMVCGPANTRFDLLSMALLGGGLLTAQLTLLHHKSGGMSIGRAVPALATAGALLLFLIPVQWRLSKPNPLALDRGSSGTQLHDLNLLSGWHEPPEADRTWSESSYAEVAFAIASPTTGVIIADLGVPGGAFVPYNPIRVRLNQKYMGLWIAPPGDRFRVTIPVRDPNLLVCGANVLTFQSDWARSERALGIGPRERPISFAYFGMEFIPRSGNGGKEK